MVVPPINFVTQGPADVDPHALLEVINDCGVIPDPFAGTGIAENDIPGQLTDQSKFSKLR